MSLSGEGFYQKTELGVRTLRIGKDNTHPAKAILQYVLAEAGLSRTGHCFLAAMCTFKYAFPLPSVKQSPMLCGGDDLFC